MDKEYEFEISAKDANTNTKATLTENVGCILRWIFNSIEYQCKYGDLETIIVFCDINDQKQKDWKDISTKTKNTVMQKLISLGYKAEDTKSEDGTVPLLKISWQ